MEQIYSSRRVRDAGTVPQLVAGFGSQAHTELNIQ
jgi:hypothetical protein